MRVDVVAIPGQPGRLTLEALTPADRDVLATFADVARFSLSGQWPPLRVGAVSWHVRNIPVSVTFEWINSLPVGSGPLLPQRDPDTRRLDWLEEQRSAITHHVGAHTQAASLWALASDHGTLREAIDAAMAPTIHEAGEISQELWDTLKVKK